MRVHFEFGPEDSKSGGSGGGPQKKGKMTIKILAGPESSRSSMRKLTGTVGDSSHSVRVFTGTIELQEVIRHDKLNSNIIGVGFCGVWSEVGGNKSKKLKIVNKNFQELFQTPTLSP